MIKYYVNINSHRIAISSLIVLFPLALYVINLLPKQTNEIVFSLLFLGVLIGVAYLTITLSRGRIKIELTEDGFKHTWIKRFLLSREKDVVLSWNQIKDYVFEEERGFDSFRLTLPDNKMYKIYRYNYFPQKDNFQKFITQFPEKLRSVNETNNVSISEGESIYQQKSFRWYLILLTVGAVVLLRTKLLNPESEIRWSALGVIGTAILFYWIQVKAKNKN